MTTFTYNIFQDPVSFDRWRTFDGAFFVTKTIEGKEDYLEDSRYEDNEQQFGRDLGFVDASVELRKENFPGMRDNVWTLKFDKYWHAHFLESFELNHVLLEKVVIGLTFHETKRKRKIVYWIKKTKTNDKEKVGPTTIREIFEMFFKGKCTFVEKEKK
jgi:hypothetical protein